jgi:chemotaxis protein MotB
MAKKKCPEFENHERWLVSYADMLTLLFAVFVTLYALNLSDEQAPPIDNLAGSMQESFSTPLDDIPVDRRVGPTEAGFGIFEHLKGNQARPPISKKFPSADERSTRIIKDEMNRVNIELKERLYGPNKHTGSLKPGEERIVDVQRTGKGFKLQLMAQHFYDSGGIQIRPTAQKELDEVIKILKELGRDITVEGHTDSMPPQGKMTNWELSTLRATNVVRYMVSRHNFPATRLAAAGYADMRPIAHNGTAEGRALNRRIEIHVDYDREYGTEPGN